MIGAASITLHGKQIVVRELMVREVELIMESLVSEEMHPLESMCPDEPIPATAVALSLGSPLESPDDRAELDARLDGLKDLLPSQVPDVFRLVREENPFLAGAVENLANIAIKMQETVVEEETQNQDSKVSAGPSAD